MDGRGILCGSGGALDNGGDMSVVLRAYSAGRTSRDWHILGVGAGVSLIKLQVREWMISTVYKSLSSTHWWVIDELLDTVQLAE